MGLEQPRELIRWAFTAKKGEVSKVFTLGNIYVVAHLADIRDKGILPLDAVRDQMTAGARIDKKAEMLTEKFNNALKDAKTLEDLAAKLSTQVRSHEALQFANPSFPEIGRELHITGTLFSMEPGKMSPPLKGESVVMVAVVIKFTEPPKDADMSAMRKQKLSTLKQRSEFEVPGALKEKANIEDYRGKFY
jgi:peptidyl-prolyl cis-trans isomerase D